MIESLQQLRESGLRIGVLANQPASALADLKRCGAADFCDDIWLSDVVGLAKPDPAFFSLAIEAWNLPAQRIAYVGDRPDNDMAPANRLKLHTVRMCIGPHAQQPSANDEQQADFSAATLAEAAAHLVQWASALAS
jgi:putative hydrolase of the HAD superfamily